MRNAASMRTFGSRVAHGGLGAPLRRFSSFMLRSEPARKPIGLPEPKSTPELSDEKPRSGVLDAARGHGTCQPRVGCNTTAKKPSTGRSRRKIRIMR